MALGLAGIAKALDEERASESLDMITLSLSTKSGSARVGSPARSVTRRAETIAPSSTIACLSYSTPWLWLWLAEPAGMHASSVSAVASALQLAAQLLDAGTAAPFTAA